jgi:hypothetical protein
MPLNVSDDIKDGTGSSKDYSIHISLREVITVHQLQSNIATAFHHSTFVKPIPA